MPCLGNAADHCCYIKGEPCAFVEEHPDGYIDENGHSRRWVCGLRRELGDWDKVLSDPRWISMSKDGWRPGLNCRDWPDAKSGPNRGICKDCGVNVDADGNPIPVVS